jgi:subtilisin family serine protease
VVRLLAAAAAVSTLLAAAGAQAATLSDPLVAAWGFDAVDLPAVWDVTSGSPDVVVAVIDSGIDTSHPDLEGALVPGHNFLDESADVNDSTGHGTAVSGIIAARANNGLGAAGVCWSCRLLPLRVVRPEGFALKTTMARAIDYAVERGAAVVNISMYGEDRNDFLQAAVRRARASGVPVVTAAGNEGWRVREFPAAYANAISVGATTELGALANYSNRGDWVKFAAPACLPTTQLGGGFGAGCGTSGATPVVAGIVALLRAAAPFASAGEIESALARTAKPVAGVRFGRPDAYAALRALGHPSPHFVPWIEGDAWVGSTLTAYGGIWAGAGVDATYSWQRCSRIGCRTVAVGRTFRIRSADRRSRLRVVASAAGVAPASSPRTPRVR